MVVVREVSPGEWETLRDIRLAALKDSPDAFGSSYARESVFSEDNWRDRLTSGATTFFAELADVPEPVGLAGVYEVDGLADLVSMWVCPAVRGQGIGDALVNAASDWAKSQGYDSLLLWVTESNTPARRLYERCGFTPTGERQPLPSNPDLPEIQLSRSL
jgi:ribosomal protein S18 acetylase RimI-like enzyme